MRKLLVVLNQHLKKRQEIIDVQSNGELDRYENGTESFNTMSKEEHNKFLKEIDGYVVSCKKKARELILECWLLEDGGMRQKKIDEIIWEIHSARYALYRLERFKKDSQVFFY